MVQLVFVYLNKCFPVINKIFQIRFNYSSFKKTKLLPPLFLVKDFQNSSSGVRSVKQQDRSYRPSFLHRDTKLTTTYGPKYFCKNSRDELRSSSSQTTVKPRGIPAKGIEKFTAFGTLIYTPPPTQHRAEHHEETPYTRPSQSKTFIRENI